MLVNSLFFSVLAFCLVGAKDAPKFMGREQNVTVVKGRNGTLTCSVENLQNYKVTPATGLSYIVLGSKSHAPKFMGREQNVTVVKGRNGTLTCSVENLQNYKVAWLRVDTQTILTIGSHVITKNHRVGVSRTDQTWTLTLRDIQLTDGGRYMCQVNTEPMITQTHRLHVSVPPDIANSSSSGEVITREGDNVSLHCTASGTPHPTITWRREDSALMKIGRRTVGKWAGVWLNLTAVSRNTNGAFLCIATNGVPPSVSKRILLNVLCKPNISTAQKLVSVYAGETVTLQCKIEAYPPPAVYWMHLEENQLYNDSNNMIIVKLRNYRHSMKLIMTNVSREDSGLYKCVAKNSLGNEKHDVTLLVLDPTTTSSTTITSTTGETTTPVTSLKPYAELDASVNNKSERFPHEDNFVVILSQQQTHNLDLSSS